MTTWMHTFLIQAAFIWGFLILALTVYVARMRRASQTPPPLKPRGNKTDPDPDRTDNGEGN